MKERASSDPSQTSSSNGTTRALTVLVSMLLCLGLLSYIVASSARDAEAVQFSLDPDSLYDRGITAIVYELQRDRLIASLEGGLFEMTPADTRKVLTKTYDAPYISEKTRRVHASLVDYTLSFPPPDTIAFLVSFEAEKPVLLDSLFVFWEHRIASLPGCSPLQLVQIGAGAILTGVGIKSEEGFAKDLPRCRPPKDLEEKLLTNLKTSVDEIKTSGPSSVVAFPKKGLPDYTKFRRTMTRMSLFAHTGSWVFLLILVIAGLAFALTGRKDRSIRARGMHRGLFGIAVAVALFGVSLRLWGDRVDLWSLFFEDPRAELSTSTVNWFTVVFDLIHAVIRISTTKALLIAGLCAITGVLLSLAHGRRAHAVTDHAPRTAR